jgi:next to BRCA1 gene 1 protein
VPPPPLLSPHVAHPAPPLPSLPYMQRASQDDNRQQSPPPTVDGSETPVQRLFRRRGLRSVSSAPVLGPVFPISPAPAPVPPPPPPRPVSLYGEIQVADPPQTMRPNRRAVIISDDSDELDTPEARARVDGEDANRTLRDSCCDVERGKQEISNIVRTFKTDVDRVLSGSLGMDPADVWGATSTERQSNPATPVPLFNAERSTANQSPPTESAHSAEPEPEPSSPPDPVIHVNVSCNMCREIIVGVRHKCLDCPGLAYPPLLSALIFTDGMYIDFDLCSLCLAAQPHNFGSHSKSHSLFAIEEPGGLWIHTIFEGEGTPAIPEPPVADQRPMDLMDTNILESNTQGESHAQGEHTALVAEAPIRHATCEFCDTAIRGEQFVSHSYYTVRYSYTIPQKCFDCPDFNTCSSCYVIVPSQHPGHSFAHLHDPKDLKSSSLTPPIHRAYCSDCGKVISGIRYKCMHPACDDFDLCANCEALPIPVHPTSHTMLKIRDPDAYIPLVMRCVVQPVPTPVTSASGSPRSRVNDIEGSADERSHTPLNVNVGGIRYNQFIPLDPDPLPTSIRSNVHFSEASPKPTTELVDISYPEFEQGIYEESSEEPVSFAFGVPVVIRESADSSQSGQTSPYVPAAAPLLPVPSPPPSLAAEFIHAVPSLHQSNEYSEDLITGLRESDARPAPWWGQSAWVPPTPPAPLPVPLRTPSTPRRSRSPEPLVCFEEPDDMVNASAGMQATTTTLRSVSDNGQSPTSLPHVPPMDFNELFDLASQFRHLLELPPVVIPSSLPHAPPSAPPSAPERKPIGSGAVSIVAEDVSPPTELASTPVDDAGTPLSLVALLSKPEKTPRPGVLDGFSPGRLLSQLLDSTSAASLSSSATKNENKDEDEDAPLRASFVADNNIPDGQIFPPGAEFVKSWRMRNDGPGSWPADTELVFVAGDRLMIDTSEQFKVGAVPPGEEVDVWTGEMKAPDVPGKYISYWRLCDSKGRRFGHSIWIE